jgi:hypothetical protein
MRRSKGLQGRGDVDPARFSDWPDLRREREEVRVALAEHPVRRGAEILAGILLPHETGGGFARSEEAGEGEVRADGNANAHRIKTKISCNTFENYPNRFSLCSCFRLDLRVWHKNEFW